MTCLRRASADTTITNSEQRVVAVPADNPIREAKEDLLERASTARSFAEHILEIDSRQGLVVGVLGPWGAGKTSFVNLARSHLKGLGIDVLEFNPWMFSGAEQLVSSFFSELSAQMKLRPNLATLGENLAAYGDFLAELGWLPVFGPWLDRLRVIAKFLAKQSKGRGGTVASHREKIQTALAALNQPIVVVLDDIDRLSTREIRDMFKLVRLTANFSNIVYIVSFDRIRIEEALAEHKIPGRAYIEKILQFAVDLPEVPEDVLIRNTSNAIDEVVSPVKQPGSFDETAWPDVLMEVIRPLIRNIRDVRRYALSVHVTVRQLGGQVDLVDVLALDAIRVFLPDVFRFMHGSVNALTMTSDEYARNPGPAEHFKKRIDLLLEIAEEHAAVVRAMIQRLFPAAQCHVGGPHYGSDWKTQWLQNRRVAHEYVLRLYLERVVGEGLESFMQAEHAWACMADQQALDTYLRSLDPKRLHAVIHSLETYEGQFAREHVVPGSVVLLNLMPDLPERPKGMFELDSSVYVTRVVYRLLRSIRDGEQIAQVAQSILRELRTLSAKLELIDIVGHRENVGHKLVSEPAARALERAWRDEVRSASADAIRREADPLRILRLAKGGLLPPEPDVIIPDTAQMTLALLRAGRCEVRQQAVGSRAITRSSRLAWDVLVGVYGDEDTLKTRIGAIRASCPEDSKDLLDLADKYLSGWQPDDISEDN